MNRLALRYQYDASYFDPGSTRDDFGWLYVLASNDRFQGCGGFWVQWQDVREFGEALATFPIGTDAPVVAQWGYNHQQGDDLIIKIEIAPADRRGNLRVGFTIADQHDPQNRVRSSFLTNYPEVDIFRTQIIRLMDRELDEAVLSGW